MLLSWRGLNSNLTYKEKRFPWVLISLVMTTINSMYAIASVGSRSRQEGDPAVDPTLYRALIGPFSSCTHLHRSSHWGQGQVPNLCRHLTSSHHALGIQGPQKLLPGGPKLASRACMALFPDLSPGRWTTVLVYAPIGVGSSYGLCAGDCGQSMKRWACVQNSMGVWDGAGGGQ